MFSSFGIMGYKVDRWKPQLVDHYDTAFLLKLLIDLKRVSNLSRLKQKSKNVYKFCDLAHVFRDVLKQYCSRT